MLSFNSIHPHGCETPQHTIIIIVITIINLNEESFFFQTDFLTPRFPTGEARRWHYRTVNYNIKIRMLPTSVFRRTSAAYKRNYNAVRHEQQLVKSAGTVFLLYTHQMQRSHSTLLTTSSQRTVWQGLLFLFFTCSVHLFFHALTFDDTGFWLRPTTGRTVQTNNNNNNKNNIKPKP